MGEAVVKTSVDALLNLLSSDEKIALVDAAKKLHVPLETLQSWVDFLVEERIVGIEYKFTKPYIYLNQKESAEVKPASPSHLKDIKQEYVARAKRKKIPQAHIERLWHAHVRQELSFLEPYFASEAKKLGFHDERKRKDLWTQYTNRLLARVQEV